MLALLSQRDVVSSFKKETCSNVSILSKIHVMPGDLARHIFKEDALEKPTQTVFIHLSYFLVSIVDPQKASGLPWPLYDTGAEKKYRTDFSSFVLEYSKRGLLTPVISSYFVNPACYKVTKLLFQLSQLAVQQALKSKMVKEQQLALYEDVTKKFKSKCKDFLDNIEKETKIMIGKFNTYKHERKNIEQIAKMLREKIIDNESKLLRIEKKGLLKDLVNNFIKSHTFEAELVSKIKLIKDPNQPVPFFDEWLEETDRRIDILEHDWETKAGSFAELVKTCKNTTESLIQKHIGDTDKKSYVVEYNSKTDEINTKDLEAQVNSQQKYILKNIVKDNRLNFPNLIRGFVISICFILKNSQVSDDIYKFNEYLEIEKRNYVEVSSALKILLDRIAVAEEKLELQKSPDFQDSFLSTQRKESTEIPPLPDLSDLIAALEPPNMEFDTLTPINTSKHHFNLRRRTNDSLFIKPQPKSLITPFHQSSRDDFLKTLISCRVSGYDNPNSTYNSSSISQVANRVNETIAECSSGFTKQQIQRLLSTRKGSSSKKNKFNAERPSINLKKGGLFNESSENALFRSHSSPNLYENKERRSRLRGRQLSVMQEDIPALLEVSGISVIENNSGCGTPENIIISLDSTKLDITNPMPRLKVHATESVERQMNNILKATDVDDTLQSQTVTKNNEIFEAPREMLTPKTENPLKKTSSIEKIINRFKKARANFVRDKNHSTQDFRTIQEEKENVNTVNVFTANKMLLPDLLSPNYSLVNKPNDYLDDLCFDIEDNEYRKPRQSLGAMLGVDQTILDQFDLIDLD